MSTKKSSEDLKAEFVAVVNELTKKLKESNVLLQEFKAKKYSLSDSIYDQKLSPMEEDRQIDELYDFESGVVRELYKAVDAMGWSSSSLTCP